LRAESGIRHPSSTSDDSLLNKAAVALSALGVASFAPMSYRMRASAYSLIFAVLEVVLAVVAGPIGPTFLVI
jgi:hypothetical protein